MTVSATLHRTIIAFGIAAALAACVGGPSSAPMSPLQPGAEHGYSERSLADDRFEISYLGPSRRTTRDAVQRETHIAAARELALDLALWRAAQVAAAHGFTAFAVEDRKTDVVIDVVNTGSVTPRYRLIDPVGRQRLAIRDPGTSFRAIWLQVRATLVIAPTTKAGDDTYDAKATIQRLKAAYPEALSPGTP